jgi:opacity protein-like surface antigen
MKIFLFFLLSSIFSEIFAQNVGDIYGALTYSQVSIKDESSNHLGNFKPTVAGLGLAYVMVENLALDAGVFDGASDSSLTSRLGAVTVKIKNGYVIGIRPFMAFNESWGGYAKLGRQYGSQTITSPVRLSLNKPPVQTPKDSNYARTVYGLGIAYNINPRWGVSSEYVWSKKEASETTKNASVGFGVRYKF